MVHIDDKELDVFADEALSHKNYQGYLGVRHYTAIQMTEMYKDGFRKAIEILSILNR